MSHDDLLARITARPDVFDGKPIVRDMRISVELVPLRTVSLFVATKLGRTSPPPQTCHSKCLIRLWTRMCPLAGIVEP